MNLFQLFLSNRKKREPLLLESVRAVLFLMYFLISLYLSFNKDTLLFGIAVSGMVVYALLVIGTFLKRDELLIELNSKRQTIEPPKTSQAVSGGSLF